MIKRTSLNTICVLAGLAAIFSALKVAPGKASKDKGPDRPALVIGIVVDQMRYDYLFKYWAKYGKGGFKRLINEGYLCKNAQYNYAPTFTGPGHASIYTGTTPSMHGIISNDWYNKASNTEIYCTEDNSVQSVGADAGAAGQMSPKNLLTSTVTDELRLASNRQSRVVAISLKDRGSILPGGHAANAAFWYDAASGNFITSTYYMKELPNWLKAFNAKKLPDAYLSKPWETLLPKQDYFECWADHSNFEKSFKGEDKDTFPYDLPALKSKDKELIRKTPFGNTLTKDLAIECLKNAELGKGYFPDFLAVSFSSTDYVGHQFGPNSVEVEDTYLRLDKDIEELLKFVDHYMDKKEVLVFLTADHGADYAINNLDSLHIPADVYDFKSEKKSIDSFLAATYGPGNYLLSYSNLQVFLDHKTFAGKNLELETVENKLATWLSGRNGVSKVFTSFQMQRIEYKERVGKCIQNGYHSKRSGDMMVVLEPGWMDYMRKGTSHGSPYAYDTHVPLLWYGWRIKHGESEMPVDITDIAPTLSSYLQIGMPNGTTGKIIPGMLK